MIRDNKTANPERPRQAQLSETLRGELLYAQK
jgi:carbamoyl-phosphate synthase small subunit